MGLRGGVTHGIMQPALGLWQLIVKYPVGAAAVTLAITAYLGLCLWFYVHQREFQYRPGGIVTTPAEVGLPGFARVTISTEDGERLDAWWLPPPPGRGVVMFLHGTPGSLADTIWRLPDLQRSGFGVLAIDYRGYGASTGTPTEYGFAADARAAYDFIQRASPKVRVAVFGESLGTGIAVTLACERPIAGLLLNAPYASVRRLFELRAPPLPYSWLMTDPFDSEAKIGRIGVPVMILHGTADTEVPVEEARRLFAAAREPKTMVEVEGVGHLAAWEGGGAAKALSAMAEWTAPR
jgi:pimeloyl-ACP methyl ester carboxylesterase